MSSVWHFDLTPRHDFVYRIRTIALYWQEKSNFPMNKNKRIDNHRIKIVMCIGDKAQDEK